MHPSRLSTIQWTVMVSLFLAPALTATETVMQAEVDATETHRQLLHARLEIPVSPGRLGLWYPKWVPGIHAPRGPVENVAGLVLETGQGQRLSWNRDGADRYRVWCEVPAGATSLVVRVRYILNQPNTNSKSIDSFGHALLGAFNWNTVLWYPDGSDTRELKVRLQVRLPADWRFATALPVAASAHGRVTFETATFREVVDSPMIAGTQMRTLELGGRRPVYLHLVSESIGALQLEEALVDQYKALVEEAELLFGAVHYPEYHFLVVCSDQVPTIGLEHLDSSLNSVRERGLVDPVQRKLWPAYLLPHEMVHSWCGKYRRPAGMWRGNYHENKETDLLWIYEGLTTYLGDILTARSGLVSSEEFKEQLASNVGRLRQQTGRRWRSLEDTAVDAYHLRGRSRSWGQWRRNQDYYDEGLLFWLEADAIIRNQTDGQRTLDDFCQAFMGPPDTVGVIRPYTLEEVVRLLNETAPHDWTALIDRRIRSPMPELSLEVMERIGYRLEYSTTPSSHLKNYQQERKVVLLRDSLGMTLNAEGRVLSVVPELPADRAGLAPGMEVLGVNGRKFTPDRIRDAVADSVSRRHVEFLVLMGEMFQTLTVDYADGHRYLRLVRDPDRPDRLGDILKPRR